MDQANKKTQLVTVNWEKALAVHQEMESSLKKMEDEMKTIMVKFEWEKQEEFFHKENVIVALNETLVGKYQEVLVL